MAQPGDVFAQALKMREATVYTALLTSAQGFVPDLARQLTRKATNLLLGTQGPFTTYPMGETCLLSDTL